MKGRILWNPKAGEGKAAEYVQILKERLEKSGSQVEVLETKSQEDLIQKAHESCDNETTHLFLFGGDGTLNDAFQGLARGKKRPILGIVPMGTGNLIAGGLGISTNPEEWIESMDFEQWRWIDIGKANEEYFGYSFSLGDIPRLIQDTDRGLKKTMGQWAYVKEILANGMDFAMHSLRIENKGKSWEKNYSHVVVSMTTQVKELHFAQGANEANDGLFNVYLFEEMGSMDLLQMVRKGYEGGLEEHEKVKFFMTNSLKISSEEIEIPTDIDGDPGPSLPVEISIVPSFVQILY